MRTRRQQHRKARNKIMTADYLDQRADACENKGFAIPKWILFARVMLRRGFTVSLYEAQFTVSKYLTVTKNGQRAYKVRFSDHPPIKEREVAGDCDFFVGHTNLGKTSTNDALRAVLIHFNEDAEQAPEVTPAQREEAMHAYTASLFDDLTKSEAI